MKNLGNVYILGDSYSTFDGAIAEGNFVYYSCGVNGVQCAEDTWWGIMIKGSDSKLILNDSSSGTTICNTGYEKSYCPDTSFIGRLDKRIANGLFEQNKIDNFLIFGGTNDFWACSPWGENVKENQSAEDLKAVKPAFHYLLNRVAECAPQARISVIINTDYSEEFTEILRSIASEHGANIIKLENISKKDGHPDAEGMKQIAEQVLEAL